MVVAAKVGVDFAHYWVMQPRFQEAADRNYISEGGGVTVGDVDGDKRPDVFLTRPFGGGQLYRNLGNFHFENITEKAGLIDDNTWSAGGSFVDIDNDRDLDLFVCAYHTPNRLFVNDGRGRFTEQSEKLGVALRGASVMVAFADYDRDGDLDGYLVLNRYEFDEQGRPLPQKALVEIERRPFGGFSVARSQAEQWDVLKRPDTGAPVVVKAGQFNRLYRNDGKGRFVDAAAQAGVASNGLSLSASWWDYNADGWPDLYVANDFFGADHLYENQRDGTFRDVAPERIRHTPWFSMGTDSGDLNNDGLLDFIATDMAGTTRYKAKVGMGDIAKTAWFLEAGQPRQSMRNAVYVNAGANHPFLEIAHQANLAATDWTWSPKLGDLDCDGRLDVFITNGMTGDFFNSDLYSQFTERRIGHKHFPLKRDPNLAYRNAGELTFRDVSQEWGLNEANVSFGAALADLDDDGDLDILVNRYNEPVCLYRNHTDTGGRLKVALRGTHSNSFGIDAVVRIQTSAGMQIRSLTLARGFMSTDEPLVVFGLGGAPRVDRLEVFWPSGHMQQFEDLPINHQFVITEPTTKPPVKDQLVPDRDSMYAATEQLNWAWHHERQYDDFLHEPLLPNKLSQLGPGVAVGDIDGDNDEDLYLGGAAGQAGVLAVNDRGTFRQSTENSAVLTADAECEDMGAVFFDADRDGDVDLYVVSGSVEYGADSPRLADRLYLNQGKGVFMRAPDGTLPTVRECGSCVAAADYDRDGDLDLFVGSRAVPGKYPVSPTSRLLRNDSASRERQRPEAKFIDVTESDAVGLAQSGMVTSALWSDVDADDDVDLLVTHEWGPVKLYRNNDGVLVDATKEARLAGRLGWWNGIDGCDVDHDGDFDYAVTNVGLNTKYRATPEQPLVLFYGDFEGYGIRQLIEAELDGDTLWPVAGRTRLTDAMPTLEERFKTFHDFAIADLEQLFSPESLRQSLRLEVNELRSGLLINDGEGRFEFRPLPALAQIAPGFGLVFCYANGDANPDLYIVQNFYGPHRETGRMDGGLSVLLLGDGAGGFESVWPNRSGLVVANDAKGLATLDLNSDGSDDFVVAVNDGRFTTFQSQTKTSNRMRLRLRGPVGNPTAIGAKVSLMLSAEGPSNRQSVEVRAGGSYLSQSSPQISLPIDSNSKVDLRVTWPDGIEEHRTIAAKASGIVELSHPLADRQSTTLDRAND
jgi:hypothetical protein